MKISTRLLFLSALTFSVLLPAPLHAYYNPGPGRWLTRDPLGEPSFLGAQVRHDPRKFREFCLQSLGPAYTFVSNDPADQVDRSGLDVYRVTSSELCSTPLHRKIVGDDGAGGSYTIEFFGKPCWYSIGAGGYYLLSRGEVYYQHFRHSAAKEIEEKGYKEAERVETGNRYYYPGNLSVDSSLAAEAASMAPSSFGAYVFIFKDCGTFANSWMRRATQSVINARASWPGLPPSW